MKQGEPTEQTGGTAALLQVLPTVNEVTAEVVNDVVEEVKTLARCAVEKLWLHSLLPDLV